MRLRASVCRSLRILVCVSIYLYDFVNNFFCVTGRMSVNVCLICICLHMLVSMCVCANVWVCVRIRVFMCVCAYLNMCLCVWSTLVTFEWVGVCALCILTHMSLYVWRECLFVYTCKRWLDKYYCRGQRKIFTFKPWYITKYMQLFILVFFI